MSPRRRVRPIGVALLVLLPSAVHAKDDPAERAGAEGASAPYTQRLLLEVAGRARELDRREDALVHRERVLAELESELSLRLREWDALSSALESRIDELKEGMGDRVAQLSKTYGAMSAVEAAALIDLLDRDLATAVLARMKSKKAAGVLAALPKREASALSKRLVTPLVLEDVEKGSSQ